MASTYVIRSVNKMQSPSIYRNCYRYVMGVSKVFNEVLLANANRTTQIPTVKKFSSIADAKLFMQAYSLWPGVWTVVRVRESKAIPGLGQAALDYRRRVRRIQGASGMLRKALSENGFETIAQLVYEDVGKVLAQMKFQYDSEANKIAVAAGRNRRIRNDRP